MLRKSSHICSPFQFKNRRMIKVIDLKSHRNITITYSFINIKVDKSKRNKLQGKVPEPYAPESTAPTEL